MKLSVGTLVVLFAVGYVKPSEDAVIVLNDSNFDETVEKHEYIMVEFYAPWCGHCQAFEPEYKKAAEKLKEDGSLVKLAKVDATVEKDLATKNQISGYPTLKFFRRGEPISYDGERTADSIVKWIKRKMSPPLKHLSTVSEAKDFIKSENVVVIGFIKDEQSPHVKTLEKVADSADKFSFGLASSADIFAEYGVSGDNQFVLFKKFDEGRADYQGDITAEALTSFVQSESIPLVVEFTQESAARVFGSPIRKHLVAFVSKSSGTDAAMRELEAAAKVFKGKAHVIVVDIDVEDNVRILEFFGLAKDDVPSYRMVDLESDMVKFKPESSEIASQLVVDFVEGVLSNRIKPFLMSQEIPAESDEPVRVLVGKNYNQVTQDKTKNVFVELYAPWCGHCKQLAPIWDALGEHFRHYEDLVIAKMDATVNEAEGLKIHMFPTLKYYPKDSDEVIEYNGERTFDALKKFVESGGKEIPEKTPKKQDDESADDDDEEEEQRDEL